MKAWGMPSEKAMELGIEFAVPETWLNELYRATEIAERIDAYTAAAIAEAREQEREAAKGLVEGLQTAIMRAFEAHGCKDIHTQIEADILGYVATYREKSGEKV